MDTDASERVRSERYLAFVDYLGTKELYRNATANASLIEDRRYELEHGIHFLLQRFVAEKKIEIGVFSDTVLIAGSDPQHVLTSSAMLLNYALQKTINRSDDKDVRLLRGGISRGLELRSGYLRPAPGISVIPFFDSSLAFAFELEEVRRGSRLYLDGSILFCPGGPPPSTGAVFGTPLPPCGSSPRSRPGANDQQYVPRDRRRPLSAQEPEVFRRRLAAAARMPDFDHFGEPRRPDWCSGEPGRSEAVRRAEDALCVEAHIPASEHWGNGRSRAERPTVAGAIFRCAATALRDYRNAQTRQFMIGGPIDTT